MRLQRNVLRAREGDHHLDTVSEGEGPAYVLFDGARIANVCHLVEAFRLSYQCLFAGKKGIDLADVAPYLVCIPDRHCQARDFLADLLDAGHGLCLRSSLAAEPLRRHLKKFLRARVDGSFVYVKYYLPQNFEFILDNSSILEGFFDGVSSVMLSDIGFDRRFIRIAAMEV